MAPKPRHDQEVERISHQIIWVGILAASVCTLIVMAI